MPNKGGVNLDQDYVCSITPTEFEKYCRDILLGYAEEEILHNFKIVHDVKLHAHDGTYQLDLYATFTAMGTEIKVICECKQYKNSVKREKVVALADKVRSLGAHKGILLSTSGFQSGAIQYAREHGLALIKVADRKWEYYSHSNGKNVCYENDPFLYGERQLPPYEAVDCTAQLERPRIIYPTKSMIKKIYTEMNQLIREQLGLEIDLPELGKSIE